MLNDETQLETPRHHRLAKEKTAKKTHFFVLNVSDYPSSKPVGKRELKSCFCSYKSVLASIIQLLDVHVFFLAHQVREFESKSITVVK